MRLVSFGPKGAERAGILLDRGVVDLAQALERAGAGIPISDLRVFLEQQDWRSSLERAAGAAKQLQALSVDGVRLGAPVPLPRKLMIAGVNTYSHLKEAEPLVGKIEPPRRPVILGKATSALCGARDDIILSSETEKLDYEIELGVVIGRTAYRIKPSDVKRHVAGFATTNDVSARDVQLAQHEANAFYRMHFLGKSFDTFAPMGPLVTTEELEWNKSLTYRTEVNGEVRQSGDTSDLIFGVDELVSYISRFMTLYPGDVIQTGSPAGVGLFMHPPRFLRNGDRVRCEIEGLGAIENVVREQ